MDEQKSEENVVPGEVTETSVDEKKEAIAQRQEWILIVLGFIVAIVGVVLIMKFQSGDKEPDSMEEVVPPDASGLVATPPPPPFAPGSDESGQASPDEPVELE